MYTYIYVYISLFIYLKGTEKVMMIDRDVTKGMGTEHDVNGIEYGVDTVLVSAGIELIVFLVAGIVLCF